MLRINWTAVDGFRGIELPMSSNRRGTTKIQKSTNNSVLRGKSISPPNSLLNSFFSISRTTSAISIAAIMSQVSHIQIQSTPQIAHQGGISSIDSIKLANNHDLAKQQSSAQNLSFVLEKAGSVKYEDRPIPTLKSPYDVLVNVKFTGICGSDVHYWVHGAIGQFVVKEPMVLGHESSGVVAKVGEGVKSLKVGDRVCMEPGIPCRRCVRCKEGHYNLCPEMAFAAT